MAEHVDVLIIGAGLSGIGMAGHLLKQPLDDGLLQFTLHT
jgi:cation diffusion facilitator CzcD-associated flavoprotein CzcO